MNLTLSMKDEKGAGGKQVSLRQGEIKTISVFWTDTTTGCPYVFAAISELIVAISEGTGPSLKKKLSLSTVTLIQCTALSGYIGATFSLANTDTLGLPVSSTLGMSLQVINSTTSQDEIDLPNAFNVSAPLVNN